MKNILPVLLLVFALSCSKNDEGGSNEPPPDDPPGNNGDCGTFNGYILYKDSEGCYYTGGNYSKVYVEASNCTCE